MIKNEYQQMWDDRKAERQKKAAERRKEVKKALRMAHKLCTQCGETKSFLEFNVDKKAMTGYSSVCKQCKRSSQEDKAKE